MSSKQKQYILFFFLIIILFSINYKTLDSFVVGFLDESEKIKIQRVIDGDTIKANNKSIRLLGINSPEKGEPYFNEAKEFLEKLILNKTIKLESTKQDLYGRTLAYLFLKNENVNLAIVKNGFANPYFPEGKQKYYSEFQNSWKKCTEDNLNICKKSKDKCAECVTLKNFDYKNQKIIFYNKCSFDCDLTDWQIKDEGRKKFIFPEFILSSEKSVEILVEEGTNTRDKLFWDRKTYVWTKSGDTLFLRDENYGLILFKNY
ncbi:MAG: thermonuclease family protein [Nanoarchaeota archaeon]